MERCIDMIKRTKGFRKIKNVIVQNDESENDQTCPGKARSDGKNCMETQIRRIQMKYFPGKPKKVTSKTKEHA